MTIPLPPNVFNDNTWMGLVLCASVAVEANPTAILDIQNSETSYNLICHLETNIERVEPLHVHHITEEDLKLLQQGGFIWLSYIPRGTFQDSVNQCSRIEAKVAIDFPGLVQMCGFHLLYNYDEVEFKETIRQCMVLFSNEHELVPRLIDQLETNETKTQLGKSDLLVIHKLFVFALLQMYYSISFSFSYSHSLDTILSANLQDFDQCRVYNSCFPLCENSGVV